MISRTPVWSSLSSAVLLVFRGGAQLDPEASPFIANLAISAVDTEVGQAVNSWRNLKVNLFSSRWNITSHYSLLSIFHQSRHYVDYVWTCLNLLQKICMAKANTTTHYYNTIVYGMTYPWNSCFVTGLVKSSYYSIKSQNNVNFAFQSLVIIIGKYRNTFWYYSLHLPSTVICSGLQP